MHVLEPPANESFIRFDRTRAATNLGLGSELLSVEREPQANAVQHKPCRLLGNSDGLANFIRTDTVLAVGQHPNGGKPLVRSDRRIFHDGADLGRELAGLVYALALPLALVLQIDRISPTAERAVHHAIRPAKALHVLHSVIGIGEEQNGIL